MKIYTYTFSNTFTWFNIIIDFYSFTMSFFQILKLLFFDALNSFKVLWHNYLICIVTFSKYDNFYVELFINLFYDLICLVILILTMFLFNFLCISTIYLFINNTHNTYFLVIKLYCFFLISFSELLISSLSIP